VHILSSVCIKSWLTLTADDAEDPLLAHTAEEDMPLRTKESLTIPQLLRASDLRRTLAGVCLLFLSQQISGVNAILYYSNAILAKSFPDLGPYVSLAITLVNVIMTFPAIFLIEVCRMHTSRTI
jgi:hypothetical protein